MSIIMTCVILLSCKPTNEEIEKTKIAILISEHLRNNNFKDAKLKSYDIISRDDVEISSDGKDILVDGTAYIAADSRNSIRHNIRACIKKGEHKYIIKSLICRVVY